MSDRPRTNRLVHESSPYLLQHAHNPVDWYAWGPEAFAEARRRNCPIFLSVGYSTCYWCHVMERQCFENETIAADMNRRFVNIKVDREEHPDVDQLYMTAVQLMTRSGGWPMNVFLTPDRLPFYGGTYFPPEDMAGRLGFPTILRSIDDAWQNRRGEVEKSAKHLVEMTRRYACPAAPEVRITIDAAMIDTLVGRSVADYDNHHGGFGASPKFPRQTLLELLLTYCAADPVAAPAKASLRKMLAHTLDAMALGGIRDHLGGGFHRYSTDEMWRVPHFEIMLYDNAMLAWVYAEGSRQLQSPAFAAVARGICDFVLDQMTSPQGAFYTALDAEVDGHEGASYLWTVDEVREALGLADAAVFSRVYGLDRGPNFEDPHHGTGQTERSVLYLPEPVDSVAKNLGIAPAELETRLSEMRQRLLTVRQGRKQPLLDTKILTGWNALMIRGLAHCGVVLAEPRYTHAAVRAADYLLLAHRTSDGGLLRTSRDGVARLTGSLDDYATLAWALLSLHDATADVRWLDVAKELLGQIEQRFRTGASITGSNGAMISSYSSPFREAGRGLASPSRTVVDVPVLAGAEAYYQSSADQQDIIIRQQLASDSPLPSGNALAALSLLRTGNTARASRILAAFAESLDTQGEAMSALVQAAMLYVQSQGSLRIEPATQGDASTDSATEQAEDIVTVEAQRISADTVALALHIRDGWHIQSATAGKGLVATRVLGTGANAIADVEYPTGQVWHPAWADAPASVYSGTIQITVHLAPATRPAELILEYQPCSDDACLEAVRKGIPIP